MTLDLGTRTKVDGDIAAARARGDFPAIEVALADVVDLAATGDRDALDFLLQMIDRHRLALAAVRKMLIDEGDVQDAMQNTLMAVSRGISSFERRSRFTTWLYRVAEREALQILRRNKRVTSPQGDDLSALTEQVRNMSSIVASRAMIQQALDELDQKFRDPVTMCDVEGMDYAAIAEALGIPLNTVRTRISRGRQYISDRIQEQFRNGGSLA
ncbi:MAG TPA: sigma-70 family RNA polymerase sigma factor [Ilumatobacteraceae bacterium]|nr:sigma-70 family RNA polymerase sigma factor [Ilumatobacteraceae bacterium]